MVIDNPYYTKIEKTVEIVHELKTDYEVPSFGEFMKSYQADEKVNYSDLSGGSVDEVKGYGSCSPSYCSGCDCSRSDCNCRSGEKFVKLYISCPATGCPGGKRYPTY
jgi:hypothetical protein